MFMVESKMCLSVYTTDRMRRWYELDPQSSSSELEARLLCQVAGKKYPWANKCAPLGSKIYVLGGVVSTDNHRLPSSDVYVIDTTNTKKKRKLQCGKRMWGGKAYPRVATLDSKIYVFGNSLSSSDAHPWAEVFDSIQNKWDALPYPPQIFYYNPPSPHAAVYHKKKRILINHMGGRGDLCYFDTISNSWGRYTIDTGDDDDTNDRLLFRARPVVVDHTLYVFSVEENKLFACNLQDKHLKLVLVKGVEMNPLPLGLIYDEIVSLIDLGNHYMCFLWSRLIHDGLRHIHCLYFHVNSTSGQLVALPHRSQTFSIHSAETFIDCFPIKRTAPSDIGSLATAANPCYNTGILPKDVRMDSKSQDTQHARRVYVDGFHALPKAKDIKKHFNSSINGSGTSDAVVDVYINKDTKIFAIVEMSSGEEVSKALALDGFLFEDSEA